MQDVKMYTNTYLMRVMGVPTKLQGKARLAFEISAGMMLWDIPADINAAIPALPSRIYCNKRLVKPLEDVLRELILLGLHTEIKTFDGCFNVRTKMGARGEWSTHSWGIAVDLNAAWNAWLGRVTWTPKFLAVWRRNGFICGADWGKSRDGMHFQLGIGI